MTDQQRFDTIAALGNRHIFIPNLNTLVARGATHSCAYSSCPESIPARYTIQTGREPLRHGFVTNRDNYHGIPGPGDIPARCGDFLVERMRDIG